MCNCGCHEKGCHVEKQGKQSSNQGQGQKHGSSNEQNRSERSEYGQSGSKSDKGQGSHGSSDESRRKM